MNFLQIGSYLPPDTPGGAEISARNIAAALIDAGHHIVRLRWRQSETKHFAGSVNQVEAGQWVGSTWRPYTPLESGNGVNKLVFYGLEMWAPLLRGSLKELREKEKIDCVIIHSFRGFGYNLLRQVANLGVPVVIFLHDYALTCMNKGRFRKSKICEKTCVECKFLTAKNRKSLEIVNDLTIIGPSKKIVERTQEVIGLGQARFLHIPNPNQYVLSRRARLASASFTLGYVGRLEEEKGVVGLLGILDGLHASHGIKFIFAGNGKLSEVVRAFSESRQWVSYRGFVTPDRMVEVYDEIDVIIVPSLWPENFSGVLVQALGNGIPAIGFDTGGIPEIINDDVTGIVVPQGDFELLAAAVTRIVTRPSVFEAMSSASLEAFLQYDPVRLRERIVSVIVGTARSQKSFESECSI